MTKINFVNLTLILAVSTFDIVVGLYDRLENGVEIIGSIANVVGIANMGGEIPFRTFTIRLLAPQWLSIGSAVGVMFIIGIIAYFIFMLFGLGGLAGAGARR
jgi:hypothetical protein